MFCSPPNPAEDVAIAWKIEYTPESLANPATLRNAATALRNCATGFPEIPVSQNWPQFSAVSPFVMDDSLRSIVLQHTGFMAAWALKCV